MQPQSHSVAVLMERQRMQDEAARTLELRRAREAKEAAAPKPARRTGTDTTITPRKHLCRRPDLGVVCQQTENLLLLIELYGPLSRHGLDRQHIVHFDRPITNAGLNFGLGELIALGYVGFTGDLVIDEETQYDNRLYDIALHISDEQQTANDIERTTKRHARGLKT